MKTEKGRGNENTVWALSRGHRNQKQLPCSFDEALFFSKHELNEDGRHQALQ